MALPRAAIAFGSAAERNSEPDTVALMDVYAKTGQQALEIGQWHADDRPSPTSGHATLGRAVSIQPTEYQSAFNGAM
jgi:hypothetical protein